MAVSLKVKIIDPVGMHARPTAVVVNTASKYHSDIKIKVDGREANLKSIMNIMVLGIKTGTEVEIIADGSDEQKALASIKQTMSDLQLI